MPEADLINERLKKLARLREAGIDSYPAQSARTHKAREITPETKGAVVAGRIRGIRLQGGVMFVDLADDTGKIQVVVRKDSYADFDLYRDTLDMGDFIQAAGDGFTTARGELSIAAEAIIMLAKSIRPLPDQWSGLEDTETRLRKRYLDTLMHPEVRGLFVKKAAFWDACRAFLKNSGFLEVDMPALESIPGGADAEPFITHHNALDHDFYLRISLELPLKKMLVGGFEKVFEIGRVFRNEGIDREHLQDYMQCEFYWAYADRRGLMDFTRRMYQDMAQKTCGSLITLWQGREINWGGEWPELDYGAVFQERTGLDMHTATPEVLRRAAGELGATLPPGAGKGRLIDAIYKKAVRPHIAQPAFLVNHPVDISPLAKRVPGKPAIVERMQIVACGSEIGNGFSELNDPVDQRARFEEQMKLRAAGDAEAQRMDDDFIEALEYGMPPAAGFGFSERLFAIFMDRPVRETVVFPLMRPKKQHDRR